jgi:hypothetical protein
MSVLLRPQPSRIDSDTARRLSSIVDQLTAEEEAAEERGDVFDAGLLAVARESVVAVAMGRSDQRGRHDNDL